MLSNMNAGHDMPLASNQSQSFDAILFLFGIHKQAISCVETLNFLSIGYKIFMLNDMYCI